MEWILNTLNRMDFPWAHLIWAISICICTRIISSKSYRLQEMKLNSKKDENESAREFEEKRMKCEELLLEKQKEIKDLELERRIKEFHQITLPNKLVEIVEKNSISTEELQKKIEILKKTIVEISNCNDHE